MRVLAHAEPPEELAYSLHVALEQRLRMPVLPRVDRLREVDHDHPSLPHEDVVGGEVAVDHVVVQEQLHVAHHAAEQIIGLRTGRLQGSELGRRVVDVADVGHEDRVLGPCDRSRDVGSGCREGAERLPFAVDPDRALYLAPERGLLLERYAYATLLDVLAVAVQTLVAEVPLVERVVDLQREEGLAGLGCVRTAQVDRCFLAALDGADDLCDQSLAEEVIERGRAFVRVIVVVHGRGPFGFDGVKNSCGAALPRS